MVISAALNGTGTQNDRTGAKIGDLCMASSTSIPSISGISISSVIRSGRSELSLERARRAVGRSPDHLHARDAG